MEKGKKKEWQHMEEAKQVEGLLRLTQVILHQLISHRSNLIIIRNYGS